MDTATQDTQLVASDGTRRTVLQGAVFDEAVDDDGQVAHVVPGVSSFALASNLDVRVPGGPDGSWFFTGEGGGGPLRENPVRFAEFTVAPLRGEAWTVPGRADGAWLVPDGVVYMPTAGSEPADAGSLLWVDAQGEPREIDPSAWLGGGELGIHDGDLFLRVHDGDRSGLSHRPSSRRRYSSARASLVCTSTTSRTEAMRRSWASLAPRS